MNMGWKFWLSTAGVCAAIFLAGVSIWGWPTSGNAGDDAMKNFSPYSVDSAYAVAKKACVDAIREELPAAPMVEYDVLYKTVGGDIEDLPVSSLKGKKLRLCQGCMP